MLCVCVSVCECEWVCMDGREGIWARCIGGTGMVMGMCTGMGIGMGMRMGMGMGRCGCECGCGCGCGCRCGRGMGWGSKRGGGARARPRSAESGSELAERVGSVALVCAAAGRDVDEDAAEGRSSRAIGVSSPGAVPAVAARQTADRGVRDSDGLRWPLLSCRPREGERAAPASCASRLRPGLRATAASGQPAAARGTTLDKGAPMYAGCGRRAARGEAVRTGAAQDSSAGADAASSTRRSSALLMGGSVRVVGGGACEYARRPGTLADADVWANAVPDPRSSPLGNALRASDNR